MTGSQEMQPTVEDCYSDDSEGGSIPFQGRRSPNAANVSTKRSHPSDLDKEMPPAQQRAPVNIDLRSDSGYSSYTTTTTTVSSTNSAQSAPPPPQRSPPHVPAAPEPPQPEAPKIRRRPTVSEAKPPSKTAPRPKSISRTASTSSKPPAIIQQRERRPTVTQEPRPDRRDRRDSRVEPECAEPRRTKYDPNAPAPSTRRRDRPEIHPSQSARDVNRPSQEDTRSMRSDPTPSPYYPDQRQAAYYAHAGAVIQPATTRPRRPSVSRPVSYSSESGPQYHWTQGAPGYQPQEHGPPLSQSALYRQSYSGHPSQMGPPPAPYGAPPVYTPSYGYPMPQSYDSMQRPGMTHRNSTNIARNGPAPPLVLDQASRDPYSARRGQPQSATRTRFPPQKQLQGEAYESYSESETGSSDEDDVYEPEPHPEDPYAHRALMPPPPPKLERTKSKAKPKSKSKRPERPSISHAYTTSDIDQARADRRKSQPVIVNDDRTTSRHRASRSTHEPSRRQSVSRPPPPPREIQTEYPARGGQVYVNESSKAERRRSAQYGKSYNDKYAEYAEARGREERLAAEAAHVKAEARAMREAKALEERYQAERREKRSSKVYYHAPGAFDDSEDEYVSDDPPAVPEAPVPPRHRRPTDADGRKVKERAPQKTKRDEMKALEYISNLRGTDVPLNDHIHSAAKRASRVPSIPSHSGSSGSDRQTVTSNGNNEIRLRVDANAPLSLQFNGDMEGRTMRLIPGEDGMAELVISGNPDSESAYHGSERDSFSGDRKALVTRSQAEEMMQGNTRSQRVRRESRVVRDAQDDRIEIQRPLRRRANSHYVN